MLKKLVLLALGLVVLAAVGLFVGVRVLLGPERVKSAIEAQASAALGMPVTVGSANARIWPRPGLTLTDVVVGEPAQMTLRRAEVSTGLRPLLSRRVEDAEVVIENSRLDLPKLLATAMSAPASSTSAATAAAPADAMPLDLRATIRATKGNLFGVAFANLESTVAVTPSQVTLAPLTFGAFSGRVTGEIAVTLTGAQPELTLTQQFNGIDLQQLSAFAGQASAVTGTLTGRVHVTGRGLDQASLLRTASGTGDVALSDGRLPGLHLVRPLILAFGRPAETAPPAGSGEQFSRIVAPRVWIDQQALLRRAIRNEVEGRAKSLFDRLLNNRGKKP